MPRTTPSLVRAVLKRDYDTVDEPSLVPSIDWAGALVDDLAEAAATSPTTARLELVERWLAAHDYAMSDQPYSEEWDGKAKARYQGAQGETVGKYLEGTKYGQQAVALDRTGFLAGLVAEAVQAGAGQRRVRAAASWLGKPPSEQVPYRDRN